MTASPAPTKTGRARLHVRTNLLPWYIAVVVTLTLALQVGVGDRLHVWLWGG